MTAEKTPPPNPSSGSEDQVVRPAWVPANAIWANGLWFVNGRPVFKMEVPVPPEVVQARLVEEANAEEAKASAGLPPGHRRFGSIVRRKKGPNWEVAKDLEGGYVVEGDPANRAARIAGMKAAEAVEHKAIADLEAAQFARDEAAAARYKSHNVLVD